MHIFTLLHSPFSSLFFNIFILKLASGILALAELLKIITRPLNVCNNMHSMSINCNEQKIVLDDFAKFNLVWMKFVVSFVAID